MPAASNLHVNEGPCVAAVVHRIVHEPRVFLRGRPLPCGVQIRLVGNGVLKVAEVVAFVREQFQYRDSEIRGISFDPFGIQPRNQIDQQTPEAGVVLGQVIDHRLSELLRRTNFQLPAIKVSRASCLEVDGMDGELEIESGNQLLERSIRLQTPTESQHVCGKITFFADGDLQPASGQRGVQWTYIDDAGSALNDDAAEIGR